MTLPTRRMLPLLVLAASQLLSACEKPVVLEKPASKPTQAEKTVCRKLAEWFPTWADDGQPETVANRIDTAVSVEEGATFTDVFQAVCPGVLR
jgi:uncharacterized protein YllA (UPF0747 family)